MKGQSDANKRQVDGVYTEPMVVQQLFVGVAQRYAVLVETKETADENYAIVAMMNSQMFDSTTTPEGQELSVGCLHPCYDAGQS